MREPRRRSLGSFSVVLAIQPRAGAIVGWSAESLTLNGMALDVPRIFAAPSAPAVHTRRAIAVLTVLYEALHRYPPGTTTSTRAP
jgi:hypothetical protein